MGLPGLRWDGGHKKSGNGPIFPSLSFPPGIRIRRKAAALDAGADDYITKPFSATELMARIRVALATCTSRQCKTFRRCTRLGSFLLILKNALSIWTKKELHVTPMEYSLLSLLFKKYGEEGADDHTIIREIWGVGYDCRYPGPKSPHGRASPQN